MKTITLRNLPGNLALKIERRARRKGTSLNRTIIEILEETLGTNGKPRKRLNHNYDFLVGTLSAKEADELMKTVKEMRKVDPEMWK